MYKKIFLLLLVTLFYHSGFAQDMDTARLNRYFNTLDSNHKFMGSVAVSRQGKIIYTRSIGFSDVDRQTKANERTLYRIGSISKTFTTVLIFKAIEQGKLSMKQTLDQYFPAIPEAKKITMEDLLYHRSGIHNFTDDDDYLTYNTKPKSEQEMVSLIAKGGSDFTPGTQAQYSNANFVLLSYILQKVFKQPYESLLKTYITQPLSLKNTFFGTPPSLKNREASSYSYNGQWQKEPDTDPSIPMGAGGIVSTPSDMVTFSNALFQGRLLRPESLTQMETLKDHYGMGLFQFPFDSLSGYGHTGGIDGFTSVFIHFKDGDVSYALTSNGTNMDNNNISIAVLSAAYNRPYAIPVYTVYAVSETDLDQYTGTYATKSLPLKITVSKDGSTLTAQATGQSSFPLTATGKDQFSFEAAGIQMEFNPSEKTMTLKQGGASFTFTRE